jgi:Zn-dependent peptidase ImmA (M78 family)
VIAVPYQRGFKTAAAELANDTRDELGLGPLDRLDPNALAELLAIPVITLGDLAHDRPGIRHLLEVEPDAFSAVTVFQGTRRTIVHNDGHSLARQNSNLGHEMSHGLLHHPPTPALDDSGCRVWDQDIEDEAGWLAGCLLVTEQARWPPPAAGGRCQRPPSGSLSACP